MSGDEPLQKKSRTEDVDEDDSVPESSMSEEPKEQGVLVMENTSHDLTSQSALSAMESDTTNESERNQAESNNISSPTSLSETLCLASAMPGNLKTFLTSMASDTHHMTVGNSADTIIIQVPEGVSYNNENNVWQVVSGNSLHDNPILIPVSDKTTTDVSELTTIDGRDLTGPKYVIDESGNLVNITPECTKPPPPNAPSWAVRMNECEEIGDSYRGWVTSEVELDLLLTYHKQETSSLWGTRQSPPVHGETSRLMWKSQFVPFDGMPFINCGSRAVIMECQFGPRRKNTQGGKKIGTPASKDFRQTCPARILIKKVKKFPEYAVNINHDKKQLKTAMDKVFQEMKTASLSYKDLGHERWYVQLPTQKAHDFHTENALTLEAIQAQSVDSINVNKPQNVARMHPKVVERMRDLVAGGITRVTTIRKQIREFVDKELFHNSSTPEKHDMSYFPTVIDVQNQLHQAMNDIETGVLIPTVQTIIETMGPDPHDDPQPETVTVTLTNAGEDGTHIISRVETHLSDGSTEVSNSLTPETANLLSKLHPSLFQSGLYQSGLIQVQAEIGCAKEAPGNITSVKLTPEVISPPPSPPIDHSLGNMNFPILATDHLHMKDDETPQHDTNNSGDSDDDHHESVNQQTEPQLPIHIHIPDEAPVLVKTI